MMTPSIQIPKNAGKALLNGNVSIPLGDSQAAEVGVRILDYSSTAVMVIVSTLTFVKFLNILTSPGNSGNGRGGRR